ncbi:MAG: hypothetical protein DSZ00_04875 [Gammaproteobacteria bacterium]|nr:MAG: hypothetical protein DSZ02_09640 [Gammaproteobacteria bacterium]RTZ74258.1 MAG: hypothetical protein DSZ00_04875 [Gammaproteobacteria bacterium]RTZ80362.1 MAG: hypothetical protein DSZ01_02325 [Gammaproteobacteria bacterium]
MPEHRFGELPPGTGFRWRGQTWTKTSPLLARSGETAEPVLVPRSARVVCLEPGQEPGTPRTLQLPLTALEALQQELAALVEALPLEPDLTRDTLETMRHHFHDLITQNDT